MRAYLRPTKMSEQLPHDTNAPGLEVDSLLFRYGDKDIVNIDRCSLERGQSMAVIGPSGCGKTTFLHLLAGLLTPDAGSVSILGKDIAQFSPTALDRFRGQNIGMVFQRLLLLPALSVYQNIQLAQQMARKQRDDRLVETLLKQLGLSDLAYQKPNTLSHGQAQRVAIARALVHSPALVLADEPTSALDDGRAEDVLAMLKASAATAGAALLIVTHDNRVRGQLDVEFEMAPL